MKDSKFLMDNGVDLQKSLELFGDMNTYNETMPDFIAGLKEKTERLKSYKESADMQNYAIVVHSLKSDARYFGFTNLGELAYQHELQSKENNSDFVYNNFDSLMNEVAKAYNIANTYMGVESNIQIINKSQEKTPASGKKILIVDDSNVVLSFIQKIFSSEYEILTATDGSVALKLIEADSDSIACMLLDIYMPNVNGFGVLEYFKNHNLFAKIPVSVITGAYTKEVIDMIKQYKIVDLLAKPFNEANVKDVIIRTIAAKEL